MTDLSGMSAEELAAVVYPILSRRKTGGVELDYEQARLALAELARRAAHNRDLENVVGMLKHTEANELIRTRAERDRYVDAVRHHADSCRLCWTLLNEPALSASGDTGGTNG